MIYNNPLRDNYVKGCVCSYLFSELSTIWQNNR
jgi:hypothetical protein